MRRPTSSPELLTACNLNYRRLPRLRALRRVRPWLPYDVYARLGLRFPSKITLKAIEDVTAQQLQVRQAARQG